MAELHSGTFKKPKPILFSEFAERWIRDYAHVSLKPATCETYSFLINKHFNPVFGPLPITHLTTGEIQSLVARLLRDEKLAPKSVNNTLILLKTMLKHAKQWGYLRENPAQDVKRLRIEPREMDFLIPKEIQLLLKHAEGETYKTLFLTAVLTGMRQGELFALQWGDIDWNQNRIYVRRSLYWRARKNTRPDENCWVFIEPKSRLSRRMIVVSPKLREALELYRLICPVSPDDLVFCTRKGTPLDRATMLAERFWPALTRAGVRRVRFHDLRHTYTALLISQGENVKFIQTQLGHASATTTLDRYGHLIPDEKRTTGHKLDLQIFGKPTASTAQAKHPATGQNSS